VSPVHLCDSRHIHHPRTCPSCGGSSATGNTTEIASSAAGTRHTAMSKVEWRVGGLASSTSRTPSSSWSGNMREEQVEHAPRLRGRIQGFEVLRTCGTSITHLMGQSFRCCSHGWVSWRGYLHGATICEQENTRARFTPAPGKASSLSILGLSASPSSRQSELTAERRGAGHKCRPLTEKFPVVDALCDIIDASQQERGLSRRQSPRASSSNILQTPLLMHQQQLTCDGA
jgi:hypothetical protein